MMLEKHKQLRPLSIESRRKSRADEEILLKLT